MLGVLEEEGLFVAAFFLSAMLSLLVERVMSSMFGEIGIFECSSVGVRDGLLCLFGSVLDEMGRKSVGDAVVKSLQESSSAFWGEA